MFQKYDKAVNDVLQIDDLGLMIIRIPPHRGKEARSVSIF